MTLIEANGVGFFGAQTGISAGDKSTTNGNFCGKTDDSARYMRGNQGGDGAVNITWVRR